MSEQTEPTGDEQKSRRWLFWAAAIVLLLVIYRTTAGFGRAREQSIEASGVVNSQSVSVDVAAARRGDLNIYLNELGTVAPLKTVIVHARVDGELIGVYFKEGQVQLGLIDPAGLPVVGAEGARSVLDRSIPLNALIHRANSTSSNPASTRLKNMGLSAQESDSAALRR